MTKKLRSAACINEFETVVRCPLCGSRLRVIDWKSVICSKNHTFDFAKRGYLNFTSHSSNTPYNKKLFEARHKIIMKSNFYTSMHETIAKMIKHHMDVSIDPFMVVDLGCGEGSHLQKILDESRTPNMSGVGIDISKEGIFMAAKRYENPLWIVGDLAKTTLANQSAHVILNILSPSNYKEFKRILVQDGLVIKVVPRPYYLKELREALFSDRDKKEYKNEKTISLFREHFQLLDVVQLRYTKKLDRVECNQLAQMTPLAWSAEPARLDAFINQDATEITVDLDILAGKKTNGTEVINYSRLPI